MSNYRLELMGYQNFKRIECTTIEEARAVWQAAKTETYKAVSFGKATDTHWTAWELWQGMELVKAGDFVGNTNLGVTEERMTVSLLQSGSAPTDIIDHMIKAGYDEKYASQIVNGTIDQMYDAALGNIG